MCVSMGLEVSPQCGKQAYIWWCWNNKLPVHSTRVALHAACCADVAAWVLAAPFTASPLTDLAPSSCCWLVLLLLPGRPAGAAGRLPPTAGAAQPPFPCRRPAAGARLPPSSTPRGYGRHAAHPTAGSRPRGPGSPPAAAAAAPPAAPPVAGGGGSGGWSHRGTWHRVTWCCSGGTGACGAEPGAGGGVCHAAHSCL